MVDETGEAYYSFQPWWADYENRTIIFFSDTIFNNIYFFASVADYPIYYDSQWQDFRDIISIKPSDPGYDISNTYYIRIRPDFQLQDLIS
jgi:hypothetical protein